MVLEKRIPNIGLHYHLLMSCKGGTYGYVWVERYDVAILQDVMEFCGYAPHHFLFHLGRARRWVFAVHVTRGYRSNAGGRGISIGLMLYKGLPRLGIMLVIFCPARFIFDN